MKASRIFLASAVAIAALTSCNSHNDEPDSYRNVPIRLHWVPQFVTIDWDTASPTVKAVIKELTKGVRVLNSREELEAFNEYDLFDDPLGSVVWDFDNSTVIVDYSILGGIPDKTSYNMYYILNPAVNGGLTGYVFNTSYTYSGGNSETAGDNVVVIGRNAIIVDKLPADAKVSTTTSVSSDIWFD